MATAVLPSYTPDQPAATVDAALRQALAACDRARECAVLWFAEVQRRELFRLLGHPSLELYAVFVVLSLATYPTLERVVVGNDVARASIPIQSGRAARRSVWPCGTSPARRRRWRWA